MEKRKKNRYGEHGTEHEKISSKYDNNIVTSANDAFKRARYAKKSRKKKKRKTGSMTRSIPEQSEELKGTESFWSVYM